MSNELPAGSQGDYFKSLRDAIAVATDEICDKHNVTKYSIKNSSPVCEVCIRESNNKRLDERIAKSLAWEQNRRTCDVLKKDSIVDDPDILVADFQNFEVHENEEQRALNFAKRTARFYTEGKEANTVLTGKAGTGKSHLAMGIAKEVNRCGNKAVLFASFPRVIQLIQSSYGYSNSDSMYSYENMLEILIRPDLLILDDVGRERRPQRNEKSFAEEVLVSVLNARKNTIITTNYSSTELGTMYSRATASRIMKKIGKDHGFVFNNLKDRRVTNEENWW